MTMLVSGASGNLGRMIIAHLLDRGVPAADIVAGAHLPRKASDLAQRGVRVVRFDYDDLATLREGLQGIDRFVLMSVSMPCTPVDQHDLVIQAAAEADLAALAYTSVYRADTTALALAPIHLAAERAIADSGVRSVILRNNSYLELLSGSVIQGAQTGVIAAAAGDGRVAGATRTDYAEAAAVAILDDNRLGQTLELSGDTAYSHDDLAAVAQRLSGRPVRYERVMAEQRTSSLRAAGLDPRMVEVLIAIDTATARGDLDASDRTLSDMIGHPTVGLDEMLGARR